MNKRTPSEDALRDLAEIRSIMERSSRFLSLSGLSGVFAGFFALAGAAAAYVFLDYGQLRYDESFRLLSPGPQRHLLGFILLDACLVLVLALAFSIYFSRKKARKSGMPLWNRAAGKVLGSLLLPLITGGILCLILLQQGDIRLLASLTLVFYGLGLVNASRYTLEEIRYLGVSEIGLGLLAAVFTSHGLLFWSTGFGLLHIVYGIAMYYRYERADRTSGQGA